MNLNTTSILRYLLEAIKMKKLILIMSLLAYACEPKINGPVEIKHVFANICDSADRYKCARADFYYVYNYQEQDSSLILSRFDTVKFDKEHNMHGIYFYRYGKSMPDTADLNKEAKLDGAYDLKDYPGSGRHYKNLLFYFYFHKSFTSKSRPFPDNYSITRIIDGKKKEQYFIRDSLSNKYVKANIEDVYPDLK